MKNRSQGFTLIELMVVLAIAATILVIGVPAFNNFRVNGRLTNSVNDMLSATVLARTEAIKRQTSVALCPSANPTAAEPTCTADSTLGWIVFADADGNCVRKTDGTEALLDSRKFDNDITTNQLRVKYDGACLSFAPTGFRQDVSGKTTLGRILMCDNRGTAAQAGLTVSAARGLVISPTGRARVTRMITGGKADDISTWGAAGVCP
jgi:type IV fimbrial biogenesis protein FimT